MLVLFNINLLLLDFVLWQTLSKQSYQCSTFILKNNLDKQSNCNLLPTKITTMQQLITYPSFKTNNSGNCLKQLMEVPNSWGLEHLIWLRNQNRCLPNKCHCKLLDPQTLEKTILVIALRLWQNGKIKF